MASEGIRTGERVPDFTLRAANRDQEVSLRELLARGPLVIEFLRGTW
jgi:peroxiredoxin